MSSSRSVYTPFLRRFTDEPARELSETIALYKDVRAEHARSPYAAADIVERINGHCASIIQDAIEIPDYAPLRHALDRCQSALIAQENTIVAFPEIDWSRARLSMKEQVDLRRFLRAKQHFLANQDRVVELWVKSLCLLFGGLVGTAVNPRR